MIQKRLIYGGTGAVYEKYMNRLSDVQLVSKGRSFIERVELDILNDLKLLAQIL